MKQKEEMMDLKSANGSALTSLQDKKENSSVCVSEWWELRIIVTFGVIACLLPLMSWTNVAFTDYRGKEGILGLLCVLNKRMVQSQWW